MKLLITGFSPFNNEEINPSYEAIKLLPNKIKNIQLFKYEIPTSYNKSFICLRNLIDTIKPDLVINVGQAGYRKTISLEYVAINHIDASISDNDGVIIQNKKNDLKGPDAYFTTLPVYEIKNKLTSDMPISISLSAGSFVCNYIMYNTLNYIKKNNLKIKAGFIHVPFIKSQIKDKPINTFYLELDEIVKYLEKIIELLED